MHLKTDNIWIFGTGIVTLFVACFIPCAFGGECGGHLKLSTDAHTGNISTPNYPNDYPNWFQCIWVIEAEKDYSVVLTIGNLNLQQNANGGCVDYIEVRNGSSAETVLYHACSGAGMVIPAGYRFLWIKFSSDATISNSGFIAYYTMESFPGVVNTPTPWVECNTYDYRCKNKECISWAYLCDKQMDCGCEQEGCDEFGCDDPGWDETVKLGVGIGIGTFIFLCVFLGIGCLEIWMKRYAEESYKKKMAEQKKRAKQKKGEKAIENLASSMNGGSRRNSSLPGSARRDSVATNTTIQSTNIPKTPNTKTR